MYHKALQDNSLYVCGRAKPMRRKHLTWFKQRHGHNPGILLRHLGIDEANGGSQDEKRPSRKEQAGLLTVGEACQRLRISRWMLQQLINRRQLRSIKVGSRRLVPQRAIDELIEQLSDREAL